jgi:hypothetical protein
MSFEELCNADEEMDATILKLQQAVETACVALLKEKKQVERKSPLSSPCLSLELVEIRSQLIFSFSGLRVALGMSATQAEALETAYNSSQQKLEALQEAALEACQSIDEGAGQARSSVVSHLRALGGHVTRCMRGELRLRIQKTLGVVQSHYWVNLTALATGYIIADDLDDNGAEAKANHMDALAAPAADDFAEILFPESQMLPRRAP